MVETWHDYNEEWDSHPRVVGDREFFKIGALAKALGKGSSTIRLWIRQGVIPPAQYRLNKQPGPLGSAGDRMWTREQILTIVQIAEEEKVLQYRKIGKSPEHYSGFSERVWLALTGKPKPQEVK